MQESKVIFIEKIQRTSNVFSFRFKPEVKLNFIAGQFMQIIFDEKDTKNKELNKYLSLSCSPSKDYIEVTKKISESKFSKKLDSLTKGDTFMIKGPLGKCIYDNNLSKIGFLAGGIGITPVISILEYVVENNFNPDISLIYSNWTENDIAFKKELDAWTKSNNIKIIHVLNEGDESKYKIGFITDEIITKTVPDYKERNWFILGPPKMVETMQTIYEKIGMPKEKIKIESFMGY